MSPLQQIILPWLSEINLGKATQLEFIASICAVLIGIGLLIIVYLVVGRLILPSIQKIALHFSPGKITPLARRLEKLDHRLAVLFSCIVFLTSFNFIYPPSELLNPLLKNAGQILLMLYGGLIVSSIASIAGAIYNQLTFSKDVPIQGLIQVVKLSTFIVTTILIFSIMIDKSPTYILSGFGALAAVILLVFKDTILGFVASIQIAANRLVTNGDWIEVERFGADGEVEELGLNTVKVRNWDKTITTIPTYALISESFKNWRGMSESGGRRIKRAINIDMLSIKLIDKTLQNKLQDSELLSACLAANKPKLNEITNIKLFRMYAGYYLKNHTKLNKSLTLMVRELQPTTQGLPIELYCFSENKSWIPYEHLQADIVDHLIASLEIFELKPFQMFSQKYSG